MNSYASLILALTCILPAAVPGPTAQTVKTGVEDKRIAVRMQPSDVTRPGRLFGPRTKMKKGSLTFDGQTFDLYLPEQKGYSIRNTGSGDSDFYNTSTVLSVDADRNGALEEADDWFTSLPVRIGDRMFDVKAIAPDGSRIELALSKKPLAGAVKGRKCPSFSYKTLDGRTISSAQMNGKAYLIDVWSVT